MSQMEERQSKFFPSFHNEERSRLKYLKIRKAALERRINFSQECLSSMDINIPDVNLFERCGRTVIDLASISDIKSNIRVPSNVIPNGSVPIQTKGSIVPREVHNLTKIVRQVRHVKIPTPNFSVLSTEEEPYSGGTPSDTTDFTTAQIIENHQRLEVIEDMVRLGHEQRVNGPMALLQLFQLNEDLSYKLDRAEQKKIKKYSPKSNDVNAIMPVWPPRVYDKDMLQMNNELLEEYNSNLEEFQNAHAATIMQHLDYQVKPTKVHNRLKLTIFNGNFATDHSDDDTEGEDFLMYTN